jgi:DNA-binding protein HU-beta
MNKTELISKIALNSGLSKKDSEKALTSALDAITEALNDGEKVQIVGFGIFDVKSRAARIGRNPKTKEAIQIPPSKVPQFKAGKAFKEIIAGAK